MRRWEWTVRSPSKRMNRCLPRASTARTARPPRRSGQRSMACRGWGVSISTIGRPINAAPTRLAAEWIVSPSGTVPRLGAERQASRALAEAQLEQQVAGAGPDDGLAVEALDPKARHAASLDRL